MRVGLGFGFEGKKQAIGNKVPKLAIIWLG